MKNEQHTSIIVGKIFKGLVAIAVIGILALFVFVFIPGIYGPEDLSPRVPDVKGLSESEAIAKIKESKLIPFIIRTPTLDSSEVGIIIEEPTPPVGTSLSSGDKVTIKVGIKGVKAPSLVGLSAEQAEVIIKDAKLQLKKEEESEAGAAGVTWPSKVISQDPPPDWIVAENGTIKVYVFPIPRLMEGRINELNNNVKRKEEEIKSLQSEIEILKRSEFSGWRIIGLFIVFIAGAVAAGMITKSVSRSKALIHKTDTELRLFIEKLVKDEVVNPLNRRMDELEKGVEFSSASNYEESLASFQEEFKSFKEQVLSIKSSSQNKGGGASVDEIKGSIEEMMNERTEVLRQQQSDLIREIRQIGITANTLTRMLSTLFNKDLLATLFPKGSAVSKETKPVEKNTEKDIVELYNRAISGNNKDYFRNEFLRKFEPIRVAHFGGTGAVIISEDQAGGFYLISKEKDFLVPVFDATIENCTEFFTCIRLVRVFYPVEVVEELIKPALCTKISDGKWKLVEKGEIVVERKPY
jgi:hypothetical protein